MKNNINQKELLTHIHEQARKLRESRYFGHVFIEKLSNKIYRNSRRSELLLGYESIKEGLQKLHVPCGFASNGGCLVRLSDFHFRGLYCKTSYESLEPIGFDRFGPCLRYNKTMRSLNPEALMSFIEENRQLQDILAEKQSFGLELCVGSEYSLNNITGDAIAFHLACFGIVDTAQLTTIKTIYDKCKDLHKNCTRR